MGDKLGLIVKYARCSRLLAKQRKFRTVVQFVVGVAFCFYLQWRVALIMVWLGAIGGLITGLGPRVRMLIDGCGRLFHGIDS